MTIIPGFDPANEHNRVDQEMKQLQDELMRLCKNGQYDIAVRRADEELRPLHEKWLRSLYQSFKNMRSHPDFYQPK